MFPFAATALRSFLSLCFVVPLENSFQHHLGVYFSVHIEIFSSGAFPYNMQKVMLMQFM
jgi:hypothetical protein